MNRLLVETATLLLAAGMAFAQTGPGTTSSSTPPPPPGAASNNEPTAGTPLGAPAGRAQPSQSGTPGAAGPNDQGSSTSRQGNPPVALSGQRASAPSTGANSFTRAEARSRIESWGYQNVSGLTLDRSGIWHGRAEKGGAPVKVWLDFRGAVGAQS